MPERFAVSRDWLLLALVIIMITLAALPVITYPLGRDQGEFATIGRGILDGRVPYVDLWNPKPPAVFYVYAGAMALFGRSVEALRAIDPLIYPVIAVGLFVIGRRVASARVGVWAALLFGVFYFNETFWTLTQNDGIAILPMVWAVVCALEAARGSKRAWLWALIAGLLMGWVVWFKYPFAAFGVVVVAGYWLTRSPNGVWRAKPLQMTIFHAGAFALGGFIIVIGGAVYLASMGAWDALVESARVTSGYTAQSLGDREELARLATVAITYRALHWGVLFILAAVGLFARGRAWWIVRVWLVVGFGIMLVQLKGYDYHWLPMLPALALLGAAGSTAILDRIARVEHAKPLQRIVTIAPAVILIGALAIILWGRALPYLTGQQDRVEYASTFIAGEFDAGESLRVAALLRERVAPGDSLFIWGFRPEIYYLSDLNPAVRFIFQFPLVADWYPPEWKEETVEILWAALPPYVIVAQVDYMPWVTGSDDDSNTLLQAYTELNNWLEYNYELDVQIGNLFIWRRIPRSA